MVLLTPGQQASVLVSLLKQRVAAMLLLSATCVSNSKILNKGERGGGNSPSFTMSYSTGKKFGKALADAQLKPNVVARDDLEKIKAFVAENTGFRVVRASIRDEGRWARIELQAR